MRKFWILLIVLLFALTAVVRVALGEAPSDPRPGISPISPIATPKPTPTPDVWAFHPRPAARLWLPFVVRVPQGGHMWRVR